MRVVDLHPEELLEKAALGSLEASERTRLDAHLAHCVACRMEQQLRADFAEELETEIPFEKLIGLGALGFEVAPVIPPARASKVTLREPRRRHTKAVWLLAAAALLVGGVAAAAIGLTPPRWIRLEAAATVVPVAPPAAAPAKAHHTAIVAAAPAETVVEAPAPIAAPVAPAPAEHAARSTPVVSAPSSVGPAEMFDTESQARRRGDYGQAIDLDRDLEHRYPGSREAQVSRATIGTLLLDRGNPGEALTRFEAYLAAGGGPLREEVMVGRATSLERLGRTDDAASAWNALVTAYPDTPYAARARRGSSNEH